MVSVSNFPHAYKEVYTILQYVKEDDLKLIPDVFISTIKNKMSKDYEFKYDEDRSFSEQNILRETKAIFSFIFLNYWANQAQADVIKAQYKRDLEQDEINKKEKYNPDNLFKDKDINIEEISNDAQVDDIQNIQISMTEHKESIFEKVKNWFKKIFSKN